MTAETLDLTQLAGELAAAFPDLDEREQRLALAVYRVLAEGTPAEPARLAERTGIDSAVVDGALGEWAGVYRNPEGAVVGFWGLALGEMPHRLRVEGRELHAWCAWDTLFLPELIGKPASVASQCPVTGETVSFEIGPDGPGELSPADTVMSFLRPERPFDADIVRSFCHHIHFFASAEAAAQWTAGRPGALVMSISDGFELGRMTNRATFGAALGPSLGR